MKRLALTIVVSMITSLGIQAQTLIIDYSEHTKENTASIHLIESKLPIESEDFDDIKTAKTRLVRTIENYHSDGYYVRSSNVTTHKSRGSFHYHYQYILQKAGAGLGPGSAGDPRRNLTPERREELRRIRNSQQMKRQGGGLDPNQVPGTRQGIQMDGSGSKNQQEMRQQRDRVMNDGKDKPTLMKQPKPVE